MLIVNPIFDTVFKHLMENNRVARFFVETIIDQPVESIEVAPHEYTHFKYPSSKPKNLKEAEELIEFLAILRYDFVAKIRTPNGYKKVLIEIQKGKNEIDLLRFRNYLGEQYKRKDVVLEDGKETEKVLPVITIYLLGFKLQEAEAVVIHVSRVYKDVITHKELNVKSDFIECLTHDSYVVQIPRIEKKTRTRLEKLLSVFEQSDFYDSKGILKNYPFDTEDDNISTIIKLLGRLAADPKTVAEIEDELRSNEYWENVVISRDNKIAEQKKEIMEISKALDEKDKALDEKDKALEAERKERIKLEIELKKLKQK